MKRATQRFILGSAIVAVGAAFVCSLLFIAVPEANQRILDLAAGIVLGWGGAVVGFYFGTSEGSVAKSEQIERIMGDSDDLA